LLRRKRTVIILAALALVAVIATVVMLNRRPPPPPAPTFRYESDAAIRTILAQPAPAYPTLRFAVLSDPHLYDAALGTSGAAFEEYLSNDRKLLAESPALLETALAALSKEDIQFLLIPGDLTKDGERASHELMARYLAQFEAAGKQVYVIPGNHDVRNGKSERYGAEGAVRVPNISADDFARVYSPFGYAQAIRRDAASLSYVTEPVEGLWLLALDSCLYRENVEDHDPITNGRFSAATLQWLEEVLLEAARAGTPVLAVEHHNVLEHYQGQDKEFGDYLVDDHAAIARLLAAYHVRVIFTGHYHAQDVTEAREPDDTFLFDVETGSLVTYPCPYRVVSISAAQEMTIRSQDITAIPQRTTGFPAYAREAAFRGVAEIASRTIQGYHVGKAEADGLAAQVADAFMAHYAGDEALPPGVEPIRTRGLSPMAWLVVNNRKALVQSLWRDLSPPDNNVTLDLRTGAWH
jgi:3',5'-cyclic AMP phosphodiesterase CpdA